MTILIIPTERCNLECTYCFESRSVRKPRSPSKLDIDAIKSSLHTVWNRGSHGSDIGLHGGECTLISPDELETMLKMIYEKAGKSGVQTNGYNITDPMIRLFKRYNTSVSISCDGPEHLNILRGPNPKNKKITSDYNRKLKKNINKLRNKNIPVSIMCVIHKENASTPEKLDDMKEWMLWLADLGVTRGRINPMFGSNSLRALELTNDEVSLAYKEFFDFDMDNNLRWLPFREMIDNILGFPLAPCYHGKCDLFNTIAVSILPDGSIGNCDRTFVNGLHSRPESAKSYERYEVLRQTECKDCKFWSICHAGCPAEGIDGDWRRKTRFCRAIYNTYEYIEKKLRGLFPNIQLVVDGDNIEPFKAMSWAYCLNPSSYKHYVWRYETLIQSIDWNKYLKTGQ